MSPIAKISIVIPSLNKVEYIEETLKSIISQKYTNYEVIVQDGGSTDGTLIIIKKYAKKYPKIIRWESKRDNGQTEAVNKGFEKANGDILTYLNADDIYTENALETVADTFAENPNILWAVGEGGIINEKGKKIIKLVTIYKNFLLKVNSYSLLLIVNYLTQSSVFLSRAAYNKFGPFRGKREFITEYDLWLNIGKYKMPIAIDRTLSFFRLSLSNTSMRLSKKLLDEDKKIVKKYTNNKLVIGIHSLNNLARLIISKLI